MLKRLGIFGTSGMAREAGDIASANGLQPIYIARMDVDIDPALSGEDVVLEADCLRLGDIPFIVGIGDNTVRRKIAFQYAGLLRFTNLLHPSATFGRYQLDALLAKKGVIVAAGARLTNGIAIGDFCIVNQGVLVAHDVTLGDFVHLAPGSIVSGNVTIGHGAWIGAGAVVNQGNPLQPLVVGEDAVIGSGAVVTRSCDARAVYVGVPARRIK